MSSSPMSAMIWARSASFFFSSSTSARMRRVRRWSSGVSRTSARRFVIDLPCLFAQRAQKSFLEGGDEGPGRRVVDSRAAPAAGAHVERSGAVVEVHAHAVPADKAERRLSRLVILELELVFG